MLDSFTICQRTRQVDLSIFLNELPAIPGTLDEHQGTLLTLTLPKSLRKFTLLYEKHQLIPPCSKELSSTCPVPLNWLQSEERSSGLNLRAGQVRQLTVGTKDALVKLQTQMSLLLFSLAFAHCNNVSVTRKNVSKKTRPLFGQMTWAEIVVLRRFLCQVLLDAASLFPCTGCFLHSAYYVTISWAFADLLHESMPDLDVC